MLKCIKWLLPIFFIGYYGIISFFIHIHIEEGTAILHAHPFQQTTDGTCHEHASLEEIILFHTLTSIHATDGAVHALQICLFIPSYFALTESLRYPDYWVSVSGEISLRAPPVV